MAEHEGAEKTEQPTPQRREKARREGQVAMSQEVGIAGSLVVFASIVLLMTPWLRLQAIRTFQHGLAIDWSGGLADGGAAEVVHSALLAILALVGPPAVIASVVAMVLGVGQVGLQPNFEVILPKMKRLNPRNWIKKNFSLDFPINFGKNIAKGLGFIAIAGFALLDQPETLALLSQGPSARLAERMQEILGLVSGRIAAAMVVIALLDLLWTRYRFEQQLMMTKQEVKDDVKETEGNPHVKAARRKRALENAKRRLVDDVKSATVVATNPTHYAVALRYWRGKDNTPVVVAKGVDYRAARIKEIARQNGIPVIEDKPLARALHGLVNEGEAVPADLFRPVAKLLAVVYRRRGGKKQ